MAFSMPSASSGRVGPLASD